MVLFSPFKKGKKITHFDVRIFFQKGLKPKNCFATFTGHPFIWAAKFFGGFQRGPGTDFHFLTAGGDATCLVSKTFHSKKLSKIR